MKVLVCGGRDYDDREAFDSFMDRLAAQYKAAGDPITHVIHGDYRGADTLADEWAVARGIQPVACKALWVKFANGAGPRRNRLMLMLNPDVLVAFPGERGTADMWEASEGKVPRRLRAGDQIER
jgi:hypothetical protein